MPRGPQFGTAPGGFLTQTVTIPYPSTTATGLVDFTQFALGSLQLTPGQLSTRIWSSGSGISPRVQPGYTGAWVTLYNDSDSYLTITWTNTSILDICPPHHERPIPIPVDEHSFSWGILYQNAIAAPACAQQLSCYFIDQVSLAAGHILREGPINPPGAAAAGLAPGTLPPGVLVPAANVQPGTYPSGTFNVGSTAMQFNPTTGQIVATQFRANTTGVGSFGLLVETPSSASDSPVTEYVDNTAGGVSWRWVKQAHASGDNLYLRDITNAVTVLQIGDASTGIGITGPINALGGDTTVGPFGVPPIVAQKQEQHITVAGLTTILAFTAPATNGYYRLNGTAEIGNLTAERQVFQFGYTSITGTATTGNFLSSLGSPITPLDGASNGLVAGPAFLACPPMVIPVKASTAITISYNSPGGTPNDFVSAFIEQLG